MFGKKELEFIGFHLSEDGFAPAPAIVHVQSIREFPRPLNISGVQAWFGLLEQVSFAREMGAFRDLLSSKEEFSWNETLQREFEAGRQTIADKVEEGVKLFQVGRPTALVTDWSKESLRYVLLQKQCSCSELSP